VALSSALALTLSYGALLSSPAGAATKWSVVASGHGSDALAITNAEVFKPVSVELKVSSASLVQWSVICFKGSKIIATEGKKSLNAPGLVRVTVTKSANNCQLGANALRSGTGMITLYIEAAK
jgi:hypothetical protein